MISIIIPVLNEAKTIEQHINYVVGSLYSTKQVEIIIVDGGSQDDTLELVKCILKKINLATQVATAARGRALQMNKGAKLAQGDILYFLHADSYPPFHFDRYIEDAVRLAQDGGCFRMRFDQSSTILRVSQWFTRFNFKICRGGDQSLFIKKQHFEALGGYNEDYVIYEDCELINRIYDRFGFTVLPQYITTSARRYSKNGTWRLQYHFSVIHFKKLLGAQPRNLYQYYRKYIET